MIQDIPDGGLKLVDLKTKGRSLKINWIKKAMDDQSRFWKIIADKQLPKPLPLLLERNMEAIDIKDIKLPNNSIWYSILETWYVVSHYEPASRSSVLQQYIDFNLHLKIQQKIIQSNLYGNPNIQQVQDIYNEMENRFYTFDKLKECYELTCPFVHHYLVIHAIPQSWKVQLQQDQNHTNQMNGDLIELVKTKPKVRNWAYNMILKCTYNHEDLARVKWNAELGVHMGIEEWKALRKSNYNITLSIKLRDFQYRVLLYKLTTNLLRHKWYPEISELCTFCTKDSESITHLLFRCEVIRKIWKAMERWFKYMYNVNTIFTEEVVILNNYKGQYKDFINTCILITKQHIYAKKCLNETVNFMQIMRKIHQMYIDETFIATKNGKSNKNDKKWYAYKSKL